MKTNYDAVVRQLLEHLPHGSGIDCSWTFTGLRNGKVQAHNSFHCMNEHGMYDGFADFTVTFDKYKSLRAFKLQFHGEAAQRKNDKYMLREYLEDTIYHALPSDESVYSLGLAKE